MRSVSKECLQAMEDRRDFYSVAEITFASGVKKTLNRWDFILSGNSVVDSAGSSALPLGVVVSKQVTLSIRNDDDQWSEYDFFGAKIFLRTQFDLDDGKIESWNIGTFTVIAPETYGTTIDITAVDDCYKLDKDYSTNLPYPLTIGAAVRDSCSTCGVPLLTTTFDNDGFIIQQQPESLTHRQFIGMCAMIAGGNAKMDEYNRLKIMAYDFSEFEKPGLYGGVFDKLAANIYRTGDAADGGSFNPWNTGYVMSGGEFGDRSGVHVLWQFKNGLKVDVDDVVITGVQLVDADENVHLAGTEGYVLPLENQLAAGKESEAAALIGAKVIGLKFRPFTGDHISYPLAEFMDIAYIVDWKQNVYQTVLTDVDFTYYGFTALKCAADSPIRNSSKYYGNEVKAIVAARKMVQDEKTDREKAVENLADMLAKSSGLYITVDTQPDGSSIYYMHNKSTLAASDIVWKLTAEAFGISTDGGKTYPYGFTVTGEMITRLLYAEGIDADYINAGALKISDNSGNILFYADYDTKQVQVNAENVLIGAKKIGTYIDDSGKEIEKELSSKIEVLPQSLTLSVENGEKTAGIKLSVTKGNGQTQELTGNIEMTGIVTFNNLKNSGQTVINGNNITTGTINCDLLNGGTINGQKISGGEIEGTIVKSGDIIAKGNLYMVCAGYNEEKFPAIRRYQVGSTVTTEFCGHNGEVIWKHNSEGLGAETSLPVSTTSRLSASVIYEGGSALSAKYLSTSGGVMAGNIAFINGRFLRGTDTGGNVVNLIGLNSSNNIHIGTYGDTDTTKAPVYIHAGGSQYDFGGTNLCPNVSEGLSLGNSGHLWKTVYAKTGTINTSDRNKKHDIKDIPEKYIELFWKLKPKIFMFNGGDRIHVGGISQDVEDAMKEIGLTPEEFGGFCKDIHYEYTEFDGDGNGIEESKRPSLDDDGNIIYNYSMRYQEFIFLGIEATHRLKRENEQLKKELSDIKNKISDICQAIGIDDLKGVN